MPPVFVTTSWDDEDRSGLKVAELLSRNRLPGTFYVPTGRLGRDLFFAADDLRTLSTAGFEIGAHTVSHRHPHWPWSRGAYARNRRMQGCAATDFGNANNDVLLSQRPLQCRGNERRSSVPDIGVPAARRCLLRAASLIVLPCPLPCRCIPTAGPTTSAIWFGCGAFGALSQSVPDLVRFQDWLELGKAKFDRVLRKGGVWHLYGHPWEIEKLGLWAQLEEMLRIR